MGKINLEKFSKSEKAIVPLINNRGIYRGRKFTSIEKDGIYKFSFGDQVNLYSYPKQIEVDELLSSLPKFKGIAYGNSIIPLNFSVAKFLRYQETIPVHFMNAEIGTIVVTRRWEDGKLLFHETDMSSKQQLLTLGIKQKVEVSEEIGQLKGITPEMRYFYILMTLDKQRIEEWQNLDKLEISKAEKEKRRKTFEESFAGRLQSSIESAGGSLIRFNRRGDKVDVVWKVAGEEFHSTMDQNFRIYELGFCAEGFDNDHSISSAVLLAEQFIDEGVIYRTRE